MKRILVPTDFSAPSLQAVRYGIELTSTVEGKLLLLHVIEGEPTRALGHPRVFAAAVRPGFGHAAAIDLDHHGLVTEGIGKCVAIGFVEYQRFGTAGH